MHNSIATQAHAVGSMTDSERLALLKSLADRHHLSQADLAKYTGYSTAYVAAWSTNEESPRHRAVPARALERLILEIEAGNVKGSK